MTKIFISHSSKDNEFIKKLVEKLPTDTYWVDYVDLDLGDSILEKIEAGIIECSDFLLILSRNSLESKWVKYESEMATIRSLKDGFMRIRVVNIDGCKVPLRFQPLKYLTIEEEKTQDNLLDKLVSSIMKKSSGGSDTEFRRFVDRNSETDQLQGYILDKETSIIVLMGMYGIGKTTLLLESISRIWKNPQITKIVFSEAFFGSRLTKELCALANLELPSETADKDELKNKNIAAIEELISQKRILIFDDFQKILDETGSPAEDVAALIKHCAKISLLKKSPLFIVSTRKPNLNIEDPDSQKNLKVTGLEDKYIEMILKMELKNISKYEDRSQDERKRFIQSLCTYPLAAKFAAPLLEDYSLEFVMDNVKYIKQLRIDLARVLIGKAKISESQEQILEILGFCEDKLSLAEILEILGKEREAILIDIDYLVQHNFLEFEKLNIGLHPILVDIFYSKAMTSGIIKKDGERVIQKFKEIFSKTESGKIEWVHWLSRLQRIYLISGRWNEAKDLWRNCEGELKVAIRDLYTKSKNYDLALQYCDKYLMDDPDSFSVNVWKIKCLIRMLDFQTAQITIDEMLQKYQNDIILLHQQARIFLKNKKSKDHLKRAKELLLKILAKNPRYIPVKRDLAETLLYLGEIPDSERYLTEALEMAPLDEYLLTLYAKVMGKQNRIEPAIERLKLALGNIPDSAPFFHRLGWLYQKKGDIKNAYDNYLKSCELNSNYFEARLGLIFCCIQLNKLDGAKKEIDELEKTITGQSRFVLESLKAEYLSKRGELEAAYELSQRVLKTDRSEITLGAAIKIGIEMAKKRFDEGLSAKAKEIANSVEDYIRQLEEENPLATYLQTYKNRLKELFARLN
ncbi:MAG: TIR domain-containing protein [Nanoarchaeota archaeon]